MCITIILNPIQSTTPPPTHSLLTYNVVNLPHLYTYTIETNIIIITLRGLVSITASHMRKYYYDNNHVSVSQWT